MSTGHPVDIMIMPGLDPGLTEAEIHRMFRILGQAGPPLPPRGDLSVAILDDAALAGLHDRFLDDPTVTDVITFPGDPELQFAGEICVSVDRARAEADKRGTSVRDEVMLYLVHGWLHLAGLDDHTDEAVVQMRHHEARLIDWIKSQMV